MTKRKRASASPSPGPATSLGPAERLVKSQKRLCNRCLVSGKKELITALRLGAGFERQKHSRRKKTAQAKKDVKGLARLEAEYVVLKGLELDKVADQHLRKTVAKIKSLKDQEALDDYVSGLEKGSTDAATLNVLARLYKVAAVKQVVDDTINELKGIFGARNIAPSQIDSREQPKKRNRLENEGQDMLAMSDDEQDAFAAFNARIAAPSSGGEESEGSILGDERPPSVGDSENEHDPDDDWIAESGSEQDEVFNGFQGDEGQASSNDRVAIRCQVAPPSDMSDSGTETSLSDEVTIQAKIAKLKASAGAKLSASAFIPTLSQAAYVAGSDSEASDLDAGFAPRKNRRGQRARQKIAEAKFGAKAKHLEKQERNNGWDPKRGAVSAERRGTRGTNPGYGPQQSGENAIPLGKKKGEGKKRDDKGELHPSWQAAKLAKEKKQIKIDVRASQGVGKKVVFE